MASVHALRCFLATLEHGSFTAAAATLGYAQPSISEQVRRLETSLGVELFHRHGRGVTPTEAGLAVRPYAERAVRAMEDAKQAAHAVRDVIAGTVRFGVFGSARIYLSGDVAAALLTAHPQVRVELIGQNSTEVGEAVRRGRLEAGVVALPIEDEGLTVTPIIQDELVYVSAHADRTASPIDAEALANAELVLSEATWGNEDSTRRQLARAVQSVGGVLRARVEVEDAETALEIAGLGLADAIVARGVLHRLADRIPSEVTWAPLDPPLYDTFAIVHRPDATLTRATQVVIDLVVTHMEAIDAAVRAGDGDADVPARLRTVRGAGAPAGARP